MWGRAGICTLVSLTVPSLQEAGVVQDRTPTFQSSKVGGGGSDTILQTGKLGTQRGCGVGLSLQPVSTGHL